MSPRHIVAQRTKLSGTPFVFFRYHRLWRWQLVMAVITGLTGGFIVTAPAMLVMKLVGKEGSLGTLLSLGGALLAVVLYIIGRLAQPRHHDPARLCRGSRCKKT